MNCERARRVLWPPQKPRLADVDVVAAREHVRVCGKCRTHLEIDEYLGELRAGLVESAPRREVRERVFESVARARTSARAGNDGQTAPGTVREPSHRRRTALTIAFVAAVSAVPFVHDTAGDPARTSAANAFVEDYMRLAVREDHVVTTDPAVVRQFILRELGAHVEPLAEDGFAIAGAEVCLLDGHRGAVIRYQTELGMVTYYVIPVRGIEPRRPGIAERPGGGRTNVVTWADRGMERALVGPLPADSLLDLAKRTR